MNAGEKVYVVTYVSGGGTEDNARLDEAYVRLTSLSVKDLRRLKQQKDLWWTKMWRRSYVETGDDLMTGNILSLSIYRLRLMTNTLLLAEECMVYGIWMTK